MYAASATQKGLPVIPADKYANFRMKRSALLASPMRCNCYRWVEIHWRGRWFRFPSARDATTMCLRQMSLFCGNQYATFPARFWRRAHDNFDVLPESREAFDQFAFGNPPKLTT